MSQYCIRKVTENDVTDIVRIYNSNKKFLINQLGQASINMNFIRQEMAEMEAMGFLSCIIIDTQTEASVGLIDYKPDDTVYLSLIMLDTRFQGNGIGAQAYHHFEEEMLLQGRQSIRIDVVNDYIGNVVSFWEKQGFIAQNEIQLSWGSKKSNALVMVKTLV